MRLEKTEKVVCAAYGTARKHRLPESQEHTYVVCEPENRE